MTQAAEPILIAHQHHPVGAAIARHLLRLGHPRRHVLADRLCAPCSPADLDALFERERPQQVYLVASTLHQPDPGQGNSCELAAPHLTHDLTVIEAAFRAGVKKLLYIADARSYPGACTAPAREEDMASAQHQRHRSPSGLAQYTGLRLCEAISRQCGRPHEFDYRGAVLCEVYGIGDRYPTDADHTPSPSTAADWIARLHQARVRGLPAVCLSASRSDDADLLFVDDAADALLMAMELPAKAYQAVLDPLHPQLNIGSAQTVGLAALAQHIASAVGYQGSVHVQACARPAASWRPLATERLQRLGWRPLMTLDYGLGLAHMDFLIHHASRLRLAAEPA